MHFPDTLWYIFSFFVCLFCIHVPIPFVQRSLTQSCSVGPFLRDLCTFAWAFQYNLRFVLGAWWFRTLVNLFWWYCQVIRNVHFLYWLLHISLNVNFKVYMTDIFLFARLNLSNVLISTAKKIFDSYFPSPCFDVHVPKASNFTSCGAQNSESKNRRLGTIVTSFQDFKFREKQTSLSWFSFTKTSIVVEVEVGHVNFCGGRNCPFYFTYTRAFTRKKSLGARQEPTNSSNV